VSPGRLIPLLAVVAVAAVGAVLIFSGGDDSGSSGEPGQELSAPAGDEQDREAGNEARRPRGQDAEALDLSELDTPKVRKCMEKANDPDKPVKERTRAILACAGPKSEQVRKAALQSCLGFADTAPDPAEARKLCRENLGG